MKLGCPAEFCDLDFCVEKGTTDKMQVRSPKECVLFRNLCTHGGPWEQRKGPPWKQLFFSWEAPTDTLQWISFVENSKKRWRKRNTDWKSVAKLRLMSQSTLKKKIRPYFIEAGINLQVNQSVQQLTDTDGFLFIHFYSYIFIHEFNFRFKNQYNYWKKCSNFILLSVVT